MNSKVVSQQGTTVNPLPSGGPDEDEHPLFPMETGGISYGSTRRLLETKREPKQIMKAAEGKRRVKLSKKPKTYSAGKNLRASKQQLKSKKRGPFGEAYKPVSTPNKGNRVKESDPRRSL